MSKIKKYKPEEVILEEDEVIPSILESEGSSKEYRKLFLPDCLKILSRAIGQVCPDFVNISYFNTTFAFMHLSSLLFLFCILGMLSGPTIWWGGYLLTYNAQRHILHSSKRKFLSTCFNNRSLSCCLWGALKGLQDIIHGVMELDVCPF